MTDQGEAPISVNAGATVTSITRAPHHEKPSEHGPALAPVTRRGRLVLSRYDSDQLELETAHGRVELLGPYGTEAHEGDEVEVVGLPDPTSRRSNARPALLIQRMRRLA
jgi:hypothetical protein